MGALRAIIGILIVIGCQETYSLVPVRLNVARSAAGMNHLSWVKARRGVIPLAASPPDGLNETKRVGFVTSRTGQDEGEEEEGSGEEEQVVPQTVNQRLLAQIVAQGKDIVIPTEESKTIMRREEDLNGVNPLYAILGAGGAAAMSFGSWKATLWFAQAYYSKPAQDSDILAVARMTSFIKQAVVGLFALGSGIFGVTALGMGIMAGIVAVGVAKGELDPSPEASTSKTPSPDASAEEVDRIMLEKAEESLRKVQADIERDISGKK